MQDHGLEVAWGATGGRAVSGRARDRLPPTAYRLPARWRAPWFSAEPPRSTNLRCARRPHVHGRSAQCAAWRVGLARAQPQSQWGRGGEARGLLNLRAVTATAAPSCLGRWWRFEGFKAD